MGADLYIKDMDREQQYRGFEVSPDAVDSGYFRDCYNEGGLFAQLGLSWWQLVGNAELGLNVNEECEMEPEQLKFFRTIVEDAYKKWAEKCKKQKTITVYKGQTKITPVYIKEYTDWYNLLIAFLDKAIELKSNVIFSV